MRNRRAPGRRAMAPSASVTSPARPTSSVRTVTTVTTPRSQPGDEEPQQVERRGIAPLQIVEDHHEGRLGTSSLEDRGDGVEPFELAHVTPARKQWCVPGEQRGEHIRDLVDARDHRPHDIEPRPQRLRRPDLVGPGPDGEASPGPRRSPRTRRRGASCRCPGRPRARRTGRRPGRRRGRRAASPSSRSRPMKGLPPSSSTRTRAIGGGSSEGSWLRMANSRSRSSRLGSSPSSSRSGPAAAARASSASAWRPDRYRARASLACSPSRNGCSAASVRSSPTTCALTSEGEIGVDALLQHRRAVAPRASPPGRSPQPASTSSTQRRATPERQCVGQRLAGRGGASRRQLDVPGGGQLLEAMRCRPCEQTGPAGTRRGRAPPRCRQRDRAPGAAGRRSSAGCRRPMRAVGQPRAARSAHRR